MDVLDIAFGPANTLLTIEPGPVHDVLGILPGLPKSDDPTVNLDTVGDRNLRGIGMSMSMTGRDMYGKNDVIPRRVWIVETGEKKKKPTKTGNARIF